MADLEICYINFHQISIIFQNTGMTMAAEISKTQAPDQRCISFTQPHPIFHVTNYF
jgi:hypothetical protein